MFALRHEHRFGICGPQRFNRRIGDVHIGRDPPPRGLGELLSVRSQESRAAIDRKICAFRIDYHALSELLGCIDDVSNDTRRKNALGIVGQQNDVGTREGGNHRVD